MQRDNVDEILRNKLHDIPVSSPTPSWAQMERRMELAGRENPQPRIRKINSLIKYAAAAVILVAVGLSVNNLSNTDNQIAIDQIHELIPASSGQESAEIELLPSAVNSPKESSLGRFLSSARSVAMVNPSGTASVASMAAEFSNSSTSQDIIAALSSNVHSQDNISVKEDDNTPAYSSNRASSASSVSRGAASEVFRGFDWGNSTKKVSSWMASAYTGTFASSQNASSRQTLNSMNSFNAALVESDFITKADSYVGRDLNHKFPISFGLSVRKNLTGRIGIETGLVYTFMESTASMNGAFNHYRYSQKLHYLGIPLNVTYSLYSNKNFNVYLMGGVMAEKAISAKGSTKIFLGDTFMSSVSTDLKAKGLLWSLNASAGAEYDLVKGLGLYIEPGFNYYLPNDNQPSSYRTYHPANFNLKAGLRVKF